MSCQTMLGTALLGVSVLSLLKGMKSDMTPLLTALLCLMLTTGALQVLSPLLEYLSELSGAVGADGVTVLYKSAGLSLLTFAAASVCRDAGEPSVARTVELCGKCVILSLSLPLVKTVFSLAASLLP